MALNANSFQNIEMGNGKTENILDWQIQNELDRLSKINNLDLNNKFITSLNHMFSESNKSVSLNNKFELEFKFNNEILNFPQLSSGERQVIYILLKVAIATKDNALILMDEPEISLHLSWQEKLLAQIREINPNSQIIIVTHSPAIVMNGWLDCFVDIQDIIVKG
jgi:ABC-type lipoprotein export system ATPase subunit